MNLQETKNKYNKIQQELNDLGYSHSIYESNLKILESSVTIEDFLEKYKQMDEEGLNVIEIDQYIFKQKNGEYKIRTPYDSFFKLERLINEAWKVVIEYCENELEEIKEEM